MGDQHHPEVLELRQCPSVPWKNGGGTVRPLVAHPPDAGFDDFHWRISVAEVTADGPFSGFQGVDRCVVLLDGQGILLSAEEGGEWLLDRPLQVLKFPGELSLTASLIQGPIRNLSVLVRRELCRMAVEPIEGVTQRVFDQGGATLVLCLAGSALIESQAPDSIHLGPEQALLWRAQTPAWRLRCDQASTRLIVVQCGASATP